MTNQTLKPRKIMGVFGLVMINVIAVDSLRSLPATAQYGFSVIFYYTIATLMFFIPTALIAGELATAWPKTGGIYVWAKEAFGKNTAFILVCLQWIYNVCWYPTILSLMMATLAYAFKPALATNSYYMFFSISAAFWLIAVINCFGLKISNYLTTFSSVFGIIIPIGVVIILGVIWLMSGHNSEIAFTRTSFFPDLTNLNNLAFLTSVLFSLMGMEMSATHAQEVRNPQRDYPRALLISSVIILASFVFASLAIAVVVPHDKLNVVTGLLEAYQLFFAHFHILWVMPLVAILIVCGGAGGVGAWLLGPVKALLAASQDGVLPKSFAKTNRHHVPQKLIMFQGIVFMLVMSAFLFMPTVSASFWLLGVLTSQLSLIYYIGLFIVAVRLRYKYPMIERPFRVPGGKFGIWFLSVFGIIACVFTIMVGFLPPPGIVIGSILRFELFLIIGIIVSCVFPYLIAKWYQAKQL